MPNELSYLRFPSVRGDLLAFVADDDVFLAPAAGGTARRLTADHAPASFTRLSPDGSLVAYTSQRDGLPEVLVVATDGTDLRRLTFLGDRFTRTIGWTDDGRVLAISAAGEPFRSRTWAYALPVDGSPGERLPYGPVTSVAPGPHGSLVLGVNQSRSRGAAWKRYRGGTAAALWIDAAGSGSFEPFLRELNGQLEDPVFVGDRLVFVADHEGVGNVYSVLPDGSDLRRHSDHGEFYARSLSSDGTTVVYQCAGELYRLAELAADSEPQRIEITLGSPRTGRVRRVLKAADVLGEHSPDWTGRASAVEARGEIHWLTHLKGPARLLTGGAGARARLPRVGGRDESAVAVAVTDAEGDDAIEVLALGAPGAGASAPRRLASGQLGRVLDLAVSPDGRLVAAATHDGRVLVVEIADGSVRELATSERGDARGLRFSPDSRYLAWSHPGPEPLRQIKLAELAEGTVTDVTPLRFHDEDPVFSTDGKYLAFLSMRTFDPVYDVHVFDMSFAAGARPYLLPLARTTPSPFDAELAGRPRGKAELGSGEAAAGKAESEQGAPVPVEIDLEGLSERVVPFPVAAGRCSRLRAAEGGFCWLSEPLAGVLGEERAAPAAEPSRPRLVRYDLTKAKDLVLVDALDSYEISGDGKTIVVRDRGALRVLPADHKVAAGGEADPAELVEVDLGRVRIEVDPPVEWAQMFDEAVRLMRDHYWIADMAGVAWEEVAARYRPWLDRIATRDDLSELLWEVQGELGSSHAYEMPPERPVEAERRLGLLGAELVRDADGIWSVDRILPGESSVFGARSPLQAPGVAVAPGDAILAVDGRPVDPNAGPAAALVGAAGKAVQLTVRDASSGEVRDVVVEPLGDDRVLRYQDWVRGRRAAVHEATNGRVGYVHIPDMMGNGWAELHRDLRVEVAREALLVDVRDNGGGHVSELVLEKLERTVHAWTVARHVGTDTYPQHAPRGPRVLVTNEQAGSDGDIVTAGFRQRRLGPVLGTRTWGGVIGIDGRYQLVDGTTVTQPRYAFWFYGLGWDVENHGVDPDVEVTFPPEAWGAGRDPQLERGIETALALLAEQPAATPPDPATRPSRAAPPLPPRPGRS
ncbi:MAG TPA: PDZ domain-containing protein [Acidimicrobiales bacterium]|nr:PDZ domain-containing protein [Acidimicrobiales bacterium]